MSSPRTPVASIARAARFRGLIAIVLAVVSVAVFVVSLDTVLGAAFPAAIYGLATLLLTVFSIVAAVRAFGIARDGGQSEGRAATDRLLAIAGFLPIFAMVFSAFGAIGAPGWVAYTIYSIAVAIVLGTLLLLNWKAPSVDGPLKAQRPVGERPQG